MSYFYQYILLLFFAVSSVNATTITIINNDGVNEGLNDSTPATPIGGNNGVTVGEQRMIVLQHAADFLATIFDSSIEIRVAAEFNPQGCNYLGGAYPTYNYYQTGPGPLPRSNILYPISLANTLTGQDLKLYLGEDYPHLEIILQSDFSCPTSVSDDWYYGFSDTVPSNRASLFGTVLHEIIHGMGFYDWVDRSTGLPQANNILDKDDIFIEYLWDDILKLTWPNLTAAQRKAAANYNYSLDWVGPQVKAESQYIQFIDILTSSFIAFGHDAGGHVRMQGQGSHFHEDLVPYELMDPYQTAGDPIYHIGLAKELLKDIGWPTFAEGDKPLLSPFKDVSFYNNQSKQITFAIMDNDDIRNNISRFNDSEKFTQVFLISSTDTDVIDQNGILISGATRASQAEKISIDPNLADWAVFTTSTSNTLKYLTLTPKAGRWGTTEIRIILYDGDGTYVSHTSLKTFDATVVAPNTPPVVNITSPSNGYTFLTGEQNFSASAYDAQDGTLSNITWLYKQVSQSSYSYAGAGSTLSLSLSDGSYYIAACATDSEGENVCDTHSMTVSAFGDADNDGINNSTEISQGTNPYNNDTDNDGVLDDVDDEPLVFSDADNDGVGDGFDNCSSVSNTIQANLDNDSLGDMCDPDIDGDGVDNIADAFDYDPTETSDADTDGVGDNSDSCPTTSNADQSNIDGDALGDACDPDIDNDGFSNNIENKFGADPADDSDTSSLMDKILAYSNQDDPEKNVPLMGLLGLLTLSASLLTLGMWRRKF